ncbi:hypothetical protein IMCC1989_1786 [gamma proteobacterium IMCC1989]|nr:hypothetical protein IMCC1989_1786 [gamma proteobacterium IMCC1989]
MNNPYLLALYPDYSHPWPECFYVIFETYCIEAYKVLNNRKDTEIDRLMFDIDHYCLGIKSRQDVLKDPSSYYPYAGHQAKLLRAMSGDVDISDISVLPNVSWSECFAVSILNNVIVAVEVEKMCMNGKYCSDFISLNGRDNGIDLGEYIGEFAVICSELNVLMSLVSDTTNKYSFQKFIDNKRSVDARNAADIRRQPERKLKKEFVCWYLKNKGSSTFKSKKHAVEIFVKELSLEKSKVFAPTNIHRTLLDALRDYEKANK